MRQYENEEFDNLYQGEGIQNDKVLDTITIRVGHGVCTIPRIYQKQKFKVPKEPSNKNQGNKIFVH